jgi:hypothetical protein
VDKGGRGDDKPQRRQTQGFAADSAIPTAQQVVKPQPLSCAATSALRAVP